MSAEAQISVLQKCLMRLYLPIDMSLHEPLISVLQSYISAQSPDGRHVYVLAIYTNLT